VREKLTDLPSFIADRLYSIHGFDSERKLLVVLLLQYSKALTGHCGDCDDLPSAGRVQRRINANLYSPLKW